MFTYLKTKSKIFSVKCIDFYQQNISIFIKPSCVFYPTCSEYTKQAIETYGIGRGVWMGFRRILRCHPWQKNHIDPLR